MQTLLQLLWNENFAEFVFDNPIYINLASVLSCDEIILNAEIHTCAKVLNCKALKFDDDNTLTNTCC